MHCLLSQPRNATTGYETRGKGNAERKVETEKYDARQQRSGKSEELAAIMNALLESGPARNVRIRRRADSNNDYT